MLIDKFSECGNSTEVTYENILMLTRHMIDAFVGEVPDNDVYS